MAGSVLEKRMPRITFVSVMKQIIQKVFRNTQSSTDSISANKSRIVSSVHVACTVDLRRAYTILTINQQRIYTILKAKVRI
jgi:hypothetical protein